MTNGNRYEEVKEDGLLIGKQISTKINKCKLSPVPGWKGRTSFPSQGKLDGVPSHSTESINDEVRGETVLNSQGDVPSDLLWSHWEPALCSTHAHAHTDTDRESTHIITYATLSWLLCWETYFSTVASAHTRGQHLPEFVSPLNTFTANDQNNPKQGLLQKWLSTFQGRSYISTQCAQRG